MNGPDHKPVDLAINPDLARQILTGFIRSELERVGFNKAVVGLSGGLDSALACYLAAEALGAQNVHGRAHAVQDLLAGIAGSCPIGDR